jgi:alginate O-acetyltransferase complex protein AlgJ
MRTVTAPRIQRISNLLLIGLFLMGIWLPLADWAFHLDQSPPLPRNFRPAKLPRPEFDLKRIAEYPEKFERYYNEHLGFRKTLIRWNNLFHVQVLGVSPLPTAIVGEKGWLYLGRGYEYEYYRSARPFTREELQRWQQVLEERRDWLADRGIPYLFVVAPNKSTIYPELMPAGINRIRQESRLDQFLAYMQANSDVAILDVREPLREAKIQQQVYSRMDSHWNNYGAFIAYQQLMNRLAVWFPQLHAQPLSVFALRSTLTAEKYRGHLGLVRMFGLEGHIADDYLELIPQSPRLAHIERLSHNIVVSEVRDPTLPRTVMIHDSFGHELPQYLSEHFQRVVYSLGSQQFPHALIAEEHPNIVIQEMAERHLLKKKPTNPLTVAGFRANPRKLLGEKIPVNDSAPETEQR